MKRPIFDFFKTKGMTPRLRSSRIAGTRLDNLEVKASYHPGGVGYFQARVTRALHFDVIDTRPTRRVALMIGGRHDR